MELVNLSLIESGLGLAKRYADRAYDAARGREYEEIADDIRFINEARNELSKLYKNWDGIKSYIDSKEKSYDRYVTSETRGCSCHINPPCSFCVNSEDDESVET